MFAAKCPQDNITNDNIMCIYLPNKIAADERVDVAVFELGTFWLSPCIIPGVYLYKVAACQVRDPGVIIQHYSNF